MFKLSRVLLDLLLMRIMVSAGEISGDEHLADLARQLKSIQPDVEIFGMAGRAARAAGIETIVDAELVGGKMGFTEVLGSLASLFRAKLLLSKVMRNRRPDILVLIDFPDFNLRLAKIAKKLNIKVIYYIIPKVWIWRSSRVKQLQNLVDAAAVIFPFENDFLNERGFDHSYYLGNPIYDQTLSSRLSQEELLEIATQYKLKLSWPCLAIFPGSRTFEITRHLKPALEAYSILRKKHPKLQALVALPSKVVTLESAALIEQSGAVLIRDNSLHALQLASVGIIKSGTSNLQAACLGLPFTMIYKASALSAYIVKNFIRQKDFSLVNILKPGSITELLQEQVSPENIAAEVERLCFDANYRSQIAANLKAVRNALSTTAQCDFLEGDEKTCAERVAKLILRAQR